MYICDFVRICAFVLHANDEQKSAVYVYFIHLHSFFLRQQSSRDKKQTG